MANILSTQRLVLREMNVDDAAFIVELLNTPAFIEFIGDRKVRTIRDAENYLINGPVRSYNENGFGLWLFSLKSGEPVGMCGLIHRPGLTDIDIGFAMLPQFEGNGYAFEIASATMDAGKNKFGLSRIVAITVEKNERSINLLKKIGLKFEEFIYLPGDQEKLMLFGN